MGETKGLLPAPDGSGSLVTRAAAIFISLDVPVVLVGERPEYRELGFRSVADAVPDIGPLGGLVSLLELACDQEIDDVVACACDLPFVNVALARRLLEAPAAAALTPLADQVLQPLFARYDARIVGPIARRRAEAAANGGSPALQALLREVGATPLALSLDEEPLLRDWDSPDDMKR